MEPVLIYRFRRRPLARLGHELIAGAMFAAAIWVWPGLDDFASFHGFLTIVYCVLGFYFGVTRHRGKADRVTLSPEKIVIERSWREPKVWLRNEIGDFAPNPAGFGIFVNHPNGDLEISPEIERFEDLRWRLEFPEIGTKLPPRTSAAWHGLSTYRNQSIATAGVLWLLVSLIPCLLADRPSGTLTSPENLPYVVLALTSLGISLRLFASALFEKIEILNDQIVWTDWLHRKKVVAPVNSILGGHVREGEHSRTAVIDTEYGEIRFSSRMDDYLGLVNAAQKVAQERYTAALANARKATASDSAQPAFIANATRAQGNVRT